nr:ImmA/IrrE family metallo-endopeptidase [Dietzia sp. B19]
MSNAAIAKFAERVGRENDLYDDGRADLDYLLRLFGGKIEYRDGGEALHVRSPADFTIFLPRFTSVARDRFTIAHELGHYFLHYRLPELNDERGYGRGSRNRAETEANVFASALLMPSAEFAEKWNSLEKDEWLVANHFDVSPAAARVRAEVLNLK